MNSRYTIFVVAVIACILLVNPVVFSTNNIVYKQKNSSNYETNIISNSELDILYPRSTIPALVEVNDSFTVQFKSPSFEELKVEISTAYDPIPDIFSLPIIDTWMEDNIWYSTVRIPLNVPEELYNITIIVDDISVTRPRSVAVEDRITGNFTFVHLTDFHIGDPRGATVDIWQTIGWKAAKKSVEEINLLHPDFVIITGDLVFGQAYPGEYSREYKKCYEILQEFQVPTFLCPGNHDGYVQTGQDGFKYWEEYLGPLYYSFDYGDAHFTSINSYDWPKKSRLAFFFVPINWGGYIGDEQLSWINSDLSKHETAKLKVLMLHHNPLWDTKGDSLLHNGYRGREQLMDMIDEYGVDAVFDGHVHYDNITIQNDTLFVTTTTAASGLSAPDAYWGYRLIKVINDTIVSYNYKEPKYSIPSYNIYCYDDNDYQKTIENKLDMDIKVEVTFLLPKDDYTVENGVIKMVREKGDLVELYVDVDIPSNSSVTVMVH